MRASRYWRTPLRFVAVSLSAGLCRKFESQSGWTRAPWVYSWGGSCSAQSGSSVYLGIVMKAETLPGRIWWHPVQLCRVMIHQPSWTAARSSSGSKRYCSGKTVSTAPSRNVVSAVISSGLRLKFGIRRRSRCSRSLPSSKKAGFSSLRSKNPLWLCQPFNSASWVLRAKSRRSRGLLPSTVRSVPMRPSSSRPEISWQPAQP